MKNQLRELKTIKKEYEKGNNIIQYLKSHSDNGGINSIDDILISYDFQAGTYINFYKENTDFVEKYCKSIANEINILGDFESIIEVGIGEATTFSILQKYLRISPKNKLGFDISLSRLLYAREFLKEQNIKQTTLFTADLFNIPLKENSVDIVYTSHSIEPNGGREKEALEELYRITNKYLILLEPAYELASEASKKRMDKHGYVKDLYNTAVGLGYNVKKYELFNYSANNLNPTGLMVIEKNNSTAGFPNLVCPITHSELIQKDCTLFSKDNLLAYPVINNIPCLLENNAIIATHLEKFI